MILFCIQCHIHCVMKYHFVLRIGCELRCVCHPPNFLCLATMYVHIDHYVRWSVGLSQLYWHNFRAILLYMFLVNWH